MRPLPAPLMRSAQLLAVTAIFALSGAASAETPSDTPVFPPLGKCIDENAARVEQAVVSLTDATTFLIGNVCADKVAEHVEMELRAANDEKIADQQQKCDALKTGKTTLDLGVYDRDPCIALDDLKRAEANVSRWPAYGTYLDIDTREPHAIAYAAALLLNLRLAHLKSGTSH